MKKVIYIFITISLIVSCKSPTDSNESSDEKDYSDYSGEKVYYLNKNMIYNTGTKLVIDLPVSRQPSRIEFYLSPNSNEVNYSIIDNNAGLDYQYDNISVYKEKLSLYAYYKYYRVTTTKKDSIERFVKIKVFYESLK